MTSLKPNSKKPAVADVNQEFARRNIDIKIAALENFRKMLAPPSPRALEFQGDLSQLLAVLPKSRKQFNQWTSNALPAEVAKEITFGTNANATLNKYESLLNKVVSEVKAIQLIAENWTGVCESATIAGVRRKLKLVENLRNIAENALKEEMRRNHSLQSEVDALKQGIEALDRECREALASRDEVIASMKAMRPGKALATIGKDSK
ncbi:hypothetical protein ABE501_00020 [Comamonas testosteroni]